MALSHSPSIVRDGLVLALDAANIKSYPGTGATWTGLTSSQLAEGVNSPTYNSAIPSFSFNGDVNSKLFRIPNDPALDTNFPSIEVWVNPTSLSQNGFWFEKGNVNQQYSLFQEGTNICFRTKPAGVYDSLYGSSAVLSTSSWNHVVAVKSSTEKIIYVNGARIYAKNYTDTITTTTGGMSIGAYGGYAGGRAYYYNGDLSIVKIYNRELSPAEVQQNFNALRGRFGI